MTRLAKRLGLDGYDTVRELYAETIRNAGLGFSRKAGAQVASQRRKGDRALAAEMVATLDAHIARLSRARLRSTVSPQPPRSWRRAPHLLRRAAVPAIPSPGTCITCCRWSASAPCCSIPSPGPGAIRSATRARNDVLFAVSIAPYTRATIETARYAHAQGVPIVAVTDSEVSPLAALAAETIFVATDCPSFFHTMAPAFVTAEILGALVAGRSGTKALEALRRTEEQLAAFNVHWTQNGRTA